MEFSIYYRIMLLVLVRWWFNIGFTRMTPIPNEGFTKIAVWRQHHYGYVTLVISLLLLLVDIGSALIHV